MNHMIRSSVAITILPAFSAGCPTNSINLTAPAVCKPDEKDSMLGIVDFGSMGIPLTRSEYVYKGMGPELQSQRNDAPPITANDTPLRKGP